ncbi:MAG: preprotein translocase subunit TatA [Gracilibacter sp. BRH_c7a]|nr:MAG: preprotein translocase subunit TatA [Gracilibacter sp. BRH_c7a]
MITPTVAVIVLVIALIFFGPGKLPQLGKGLGKGIKEFKTEANLDTEEKDNTSERKQVES